jgi:short-subunit dehydrogenase
MKLSHKDKIRIKKEYGPWALVTGASSGIGKELAERLCESGLNVILVATKRDDIVEIGDKFEKKYQVRTLAVDADLSAKEGVKKVITSTANLDIGLLVAAAGFGTSGELINSSLDEELKMLNVNSMAVLHMVHHFGKMFAAKKGGGIILMSSIVAFQGVPYSANYAATKAFVQSLAEALYIELKPQGVDVLSAAPGPVKSGFGERANMKMGDVLKPEDIGVPILNALGRRSMIVPGTLSKVLTYSLRTAPRWAKTRIMKVVMGGMTKHHRLR